MKTKIVRCRTAYSKPDKQEVNGTVILPALVFPACGIFNIDSSDRRTFSVINYVLINAIF